MGRVDSTEGWRSGRVARRALCRRVAVLSALGLTLVACRASRIDAYRNESAVAPSLRMQAILAPSSRSASLEIRELDRLVRARHTLSEEAWAAAKLRMASLHTKLGDYDEAVAHVRDVVSRVPPPTARARALCGLIGGRALLALDRHADARESFDSALALSTDTSLTAALQEARGRLPGSVATAKPATDIRVVSRSEWGARRPRVDRMDPMGRPSRITVHHSALWCSDSAGRAYDLARIFQRTHMEERGWGDIGYHWLIDRSGRILAGRDLRYQGAHAGNGERNRRNIGICLLGNFEPGRKERAQRPSAAQLRSLEGLVRAQAQAWSIEPDQIFTHREIHPHGTGATACPGIWLSPFVAHMRERLGSELVVGTR